MSVFVSLPSLWFSPMSDEDIDWGDSDNGEPMEGGDDGWGDMVEVDPSDAAVSSVGVGEQKADGDDSLNPSWTRNLDDTYIFSSAAFATIPKRVSYLLFFSVLCFL